MGKVIRIGDKNSALNHLGSFTNYSELVTLHPTGDQVGQLAYCINSQGTAWLPGSLGGTYYSKGTYCWNGTIWDDSVSEIADALQNLNKQETARQTITSETATTISVLGDWYDLLGTYTVDTLNEFDSPSNGILRHIGENTYLFRAEGIYLISDTAGTVAQIRLKVFDGVTTTYTNPIEREVISLSGPNDYAIFNILELIELGENFQVSVQIRNQSNTNNLTSLINSVLLIDKA